MNHEEQKKEILAQFEHEHGWKPQEPERQGLRRGLKEFTGIALITTTLITGIALARESPESPQQRIFFDEETSRIAREQARVSLEQEPLPKLYPLFEHYLTLVTTVSERTTVPRYVLEGIIYGANGRDDMPFFESREILGHPDRIPILGVRLATDKEQCLLSIASFLRESHKKTEDWRDSITLLYGSEQDVYEARRQAKTYKNIELNAPLHEMNIPEPFLGATFKHITREQARELSYWPRHLPEKARNAILMMDKCEVFQQ